MAYKPPRVLTIAGSDPSGGAGIEADIKTITALGGYAATAITALTAQNTKGVEGIIPTPVDFLQKQISMVLSDIGADAIKIGMLGNAEVVEAVANELPDNIPVVVDPVMVATSGAKLLEDDAIEALKTHLIPKATILTPNIPEAEILTGMTIKTFGDFGRAGKMLQDMGARSVLIKGGHGEGDEIADVLVGENLVEVYKKQRIKTRHTHGTGCTLSSAIAVGLASGLDHKKAVEMGIDYVLKAIRNAPEFGAGNGPLGHKF